MNKNTLSEMAENLDRMLKSKRWSGKGVFIFGHCAASEKMIDLLLAGGVTPAAILDNNRAKQGRDYRGVPIRDPDTIRAADGSASVVLIASRAYASMAAQLVRMRYRGEICKVVDYNTFADYSLTLETFTQKKERVLRGIATLAEIRKRHGNRYLVICPNNALGDVFLALSYLPAYCHRHDLGETVVAVTEGGCRRVAELFRTSRLLGLNTDGMDELVQAVLFTGEARCIIAHHDRPYTDNIIRYLDRRFLSFEDYYKVAVYGLDRETLPAPAEGRTAFTGISKLRAGKTVILSPYAKSVAPLPDLFWEETAGYFLARGFMVCTNVSGDEPPIRGTEPLNIPLDQALSAVEMAGCFVGLRSGLCEIVSGARARKVVFFPDCAYSTSPFGVSEFFALSGWENHVVRGDSCLHSILEDRIQ